MTESEREAARRRRPLWRDVAPEFDQQRWRGIRTPPTCSMEDLLVPADAENVTQDFFLALLAWQRLSGLTREGGRFRSFLLAALKNHLANAWDRAHAARRGGGLKSCRNLGPWLLWNLCGHE